VTIAMSTERARRFAHENVNLDRSDADFAAYA
jgi:hypothetical protein